MTLGAREIKYLGHLLSLQRIKIMPNRIVDIQHYPHPTNLRALWRFIGMVGFYGQFIADYSWKATMLHKIKKKEDQFTWRHEHQSAFESLKQVLCEALILQILDFNKSLSLRQMSVTLPYPQFYISKVMEN